jgi:anti-repressor protein
MNDIKVFQNTQFGSVRTVTQGGEPWFVGKDVAERLGYRDTADALKKHVDGDDKLTRRFADSGQSREMYIINESGLYSLVLSSKLPEAKAFKRWITHEVIPAIRKHGAYATPEMVEKMLGDPDVMIRTLTALKEEREKNAALTAQAEADKPKVLFAESVSAAQTSILIGELAKLIKQNGVDVGQTRLFQWLRDNGYLMKSGASYNLPTQKSVEMGLLEIKETAINNPDGSVRLTRTPKVTGKVQVYFVNKFLNKAEA